MRLLLLCAGDIERNPGPRIDQKPTMPQLIAFQGKSKHIDIAQEIGDQWQKVGISLLNDENGTIMPAIAQQYNNNIQCINVEVLTRWVRGQGIPDTTWQGLLGVLQVHCRVLAERIEEVLTEDRAIDSPAIPQEYSLERAPAVEDVDSSITHRQDNLATSSHEVSIAPQPCPEEQHEHSHPPTEQQSQPSSPSFTDQSKLLPPSIFASHSPQPQSAEWHFAEYLKRIYGCPIDSVDTWPPSPSKIYINLALITREEVKTSEQQEEMYKMILDSTHGNIDDILKKKVPIQLNTMLDSKPGEDLKCILIEGAPGVGKSTLAWEICKCWAGGTLFQQYTLVMLLRLRDETVQAAKTIADLVHYMVEEGVDSISEYLKSTCGKHTLIILEGLDELPQQLLSHTSIFTHLLAGSCSKLRCATIMITSRPSVTAQLWRKWKSRITRHVEILGFTEKNIEMYVSSVLDQEEIAGLNTYLCTASSIKQMMYIPLYSGIVIEIYRMCKLSKKSFPTNKTALYKVLVQTILTRYLATHPKYKDDVIEVEKFSDLPCDVYPAFMKLLELAYNGVVEQQLIFKDIESEIQHLGFMDAVTELYALNRRARYSYNFLHLSIQEFLGACYVSLMDADKQESLLKTMCTTDHLLNMALFLAGLTKFKDLNRSIVKTAIQSTCEFSRGELGELALSDYALKIVYETDDASLLEGYDFYWYNLTKYSPLFCFTAVGYCVSKSNFKWRLLIGNTSIAKDTSKYIQSVEGIQLLTQALSAQPTPRYIIDELAFYHVQPDAEQCLPSLLPKLRRLHKLWLYAAPADILNRTMHALMTAPITTLELINLSGSKCSSQALNDLCKVLLNNSQYIEEVVLQYCLIDNKGALCLSSHMSKLSKLTRLSLDYNDITDSGAWAIIISVRSLRPKHLSLQNNKISYKGKMELHKFKEENTAEWLHY